MRANTAMGRVRTKTVKKAARVIAEKYYAKLTLDFQKLGKGGCGYQRTMKIDFGQRNAAVIPMEAPPLGATVSGLRGHLRVNKKITEEVATIPSKRLRNKIAGFTTHLMKRIGKGPLAERCQKMALRGWTAGGVYGSCKLVCVPNQGFS